jgi:hypothetical protein
LLFCFADCKSRATLEELARVGNLTASHLMSVGSALSHVHIPNHPLKDVETDEYLATEQLGPETGSSVWEYSHPIFYFRL